MSSDMDILQKKLEEAISRIEQLEGYLAPRSSNSEQQGWKYLVLRPHPWRKQLSIKGRNLTVGQLIATLKTNNLSVEQAASDLDLPEEAIREALKYYDENKALIEMEAAEERRWLRERGYSSGPQTLP